MVNKAKQGYRVRGGGGGGQNIYYLFIFFYSCFRIFINIFINHIFEGGGGYAWGRGGGGNLSTIHILNAWFLCVLCYFLLRGK